MDDKIANELVTAVERIADAAQLMAISQRDMHGRLAELVHAAERIADSCERSKTTLDALTAAVEKIERRS